MFYIFDFYTFLQICIALILTVFLWMYFMIDDADGTGFSLHTLSSKITKFPTSSSSSDVTSHVDTIPDRPLPPGPHQLTPEQVNDSKVHHYLTQLSSEYGAIYSFKVEGSFIIVVNGYDAIMEVLVKEGEKFISRPVMPREIQFNPKQLGIYTAPYGAGWKAQRNFMVSSFHKMGAAGPRLEREILYECQCLIQALKDTHEDVIDLEAFIPLALGNIIHFILFGHRQNYTDEAYLALFDDLYDYFEGPDVTDVDAAEEPLMEVTTKIQTYIQNQINNHKKTIEDNKPRDFTDLYLMEIKKTANETGAEFNEEQLRILLFELMVTSLTPLINTLKWAMLYITNNYDLQENVQAEIDKVLGADTSPSMAHRKKLPYTCATISECQRLSCVSALAVPHKSIRNDRDVELRGFRVPQDAEIWLNMWSINQDPALWPDPHLLRPSRFLDHRGHYVKQEKLLTYSAGDRMCPAMKAANMQIFLFFSHLLQYFRFERPQGVEIYPEDGSYSDVLSCPDYTVLVLRR